MSVVSVPPLSVGSAAAPESIERLAKNTNSSFPAGPLPKPRNEKEADSEQLQSAVFGDWEQNETLSAQDDLGEMSSKEFPEPLSREEFDVLIEKHRQQIVLYLISMVQNIADAEDLCQKCCVIMWQKSSEYDRRKSFLPWACGIARLESYNYRRSRSTERLQFGSDVLQLLATSLEEMGNSSQDQRLSALKKCVTALPELEQSFLRRIYWEGNSFESIAADLGCSPRTFYNRMYLLRRRLWRCVSRKLSEEH